MCMIIKKTTSIQKNAGSLLSVIPKVATEFLDIDKGDILVWEIDTKNETIMVKKLE